MNIAVFDDIKGAPLAFYGADNLRFKLGDVVWEAKEDEADGYRSYLDTISVAEGGIFFSQPVATVVVEDLIEAEFQGYVLRDVERDHIWIKVGTDHADDYYPLFVFEYQPYKEVAQR